MRIAVSLIAAGFAAILLIPSAAAGADFDRFLNGLDHACKSSPPFEKFWNSVVDRYGEAKDPRPKVQVPADLLPAFGPITPSDKPEHTEVSIPLDGTFRGLKLTRILFWVGKGNGIGGYRVDFAEPAAKLKSVLGNAVAKGKKQMAAGDDTGSLTTGFTIETGIVGVFCDFSN